MDGERQPEGEEIFSQFLQTGGTRDVTVEIPIPLQSSSGSQSGSGSQPGAGLLNPAVGVGTQYHQRVLYQHPLPYDQHMRPIYLHQPVLDPRMQVDGYGAPLNQQQRVLPPMTPQPQQFYYGFEHDQQQLGRFPSWRGVGNYNYRQPHPQGPQAFYAAPSWQRSPFSPFVRIPTPKAVLKFSRPSAPMSAETNTEPEDVVSLGSSSSEDEESNDNTIAPNLSDEDTSFLLRDEYDELLKLSTDGSYKLQIKGDVFGKPTQSDEDFAKFKEHVKADLNDTENTVGGCISITEDEAGASEQNVKIKVEVKQEIEEEIESDPWPMEADPGPIDDTYESLIPDGDHLQMNQFFDNEKPLKVDQEIASVGTPITYGVLFNHLNIFARPSLSTSNLAIIGPDSLCYTLKNEIMKDGIDEENIVISNTLDEIQHLDVRISYIAYLRPCDEKLPIKRFLNEIQALLNCASSSKNFDILLCRDSQNNKKGYPSTKTLALLVERFGISMHPFYYDRPDSVVDEAEYCASRFRFASALDIDDAGVKIETFQSN